MIICYHGTNEAKAKSILKHGFLPCTYFAVHLEDAIWFGGNHVLEVAFHEAPDRWQFVCPEKVDASMIVSYIVYAHRVKFRNESLRKKVFESNIGKYVPRRRFVRAPSTSKLYAPKRKKRAVRVRA